MISGSPDGDRVLARSLLITSRSTLSTQGTLFIGQREQCSRDSIISVHNKDNIGNIVSATEEGTSPITDVHTGVIARIGNSECTRASSGDPGVTGAAVAVGPTQSARRNAAGVLTARSWKSGSADPSLAVDVGNNCGKERSDGERSLHVEE